MKRGFSEAPTGFVSASQTARVETEEWAARHMFCPNCGNPNLTSFEANRPVADFFCDGCGNEFELKSQSRAFGRKVADGAYYTKMERLAEDKSPNLILLQYDRGLREVVNLKVVPSFFFVASAIERRRPLGPNARRAGWIGSNIRLDKIPLVGQIPVISDRFIRTKSTVLEEWSDLKYVDKKFGEARGWLISVMKCVEDLGPEEFSLAEVYAFEKELAALFPNNNNVRPKIRQQLQVLRDNGFLQFTSRGRYKLLEQ
ncbi:MAG: DpnI domain-containing protein [Pseudomonadota bacterium]